MLVRKKKYDDKVRDLESAKLRIARLEKYGERLDGIIDGQRDAIKAAGLSVFVCTPALDKGRVQVQVVQTVDMRGLANCPRDQRDLILRGMVNHASMSVAQELERFVREGIKA